jgi:hypothetical protein
MDNEGLWMIDLYYTVVFQGHFDRMHWGKEARVRRIPQE